jgi:hypothetical protein
MIFCTVIKINKRIAHLKPLFLGLQENHYYREKIWSGISLALAIESIQMDQGRTGQLNLDIGRQRERIEK